MFMMPYCIKELWISMILLKNTGKLHKIAPSDNAWFYCYNLCSLLTVAQILIVRVCSSGLLYLISLQVKFQILPLFCWALMCPFWHNKVQPFARYCVWTNRQVDGKSDFLYVHRFNFLKNIIIYHFHNTEQICSQRRTSSFLHCSFIKMCYTDI